MCGDCWLLIVVEVCESCNSSREPKMACVACDPQFVNTRCFAVDVAEHVLSSNSVVLWLFGSWGIFSWFVVCSRSVLNFCPDPCVVRSKLLMQWLVGEMCVVDDVSIWHLFSRWRRFLHRGMASLISVYWCGFTCLEKRKVHHFAWEICCPFCVFVCTTLCSMMRQMTSRTRCGSHSHLSCVTTIEAFVWETNACLDTFFMCTRCVQGVCNFLFFFCGMTAFSGRRQSNIIFASDITESDCMARSSCFSIDDCMEHYTFREISSPDSLWDRTVVRNMCCRCRVFIFSVQACLRSWHFSIAWSPVPLHQDTPLQQHVTWPPFYLWVIQVLVGLGNAKVEGFLLSLRVFRSSEKCFVLRFLGLPSVSFDQVRMLSHEQSRGECLFVDFFFFFQTFRHSFSSTFIVRNGIGSKFVSRNG